VLIELSSRGYRIEVNAIAADGRFNAEMRACSNCSPGTSRASKRSRVLKLDAEHAERAGELWARRWVDAQLNDGPEGARQ